MLKFFLANYYRSYGFGGYDNIYCTVVANTESEALGLLIEQYVKTDAKYWCVWEPDCSKISVDEISNNSN